MCTYEVVGTIYIHFSRLFIPRLSLCIMITQSLTAQWEGENAQVADIVLVLFPLLQQEVDAVGKSVKQWLPISNLSMEEYLS